MKFFKRVCVLEIINLMLNEIYEFPLLLFFVSIFQPQKELQVFRSSASDIAKNIFLLSDVVERQKLLAINTQNLANSSAKQKEIEQQQIQTKIVELSLELDRLKIELKYLQKCESELQEIFDNFRQNQ